MLIPFNIGARAGGLVAEFIGISALQTANVALPLPGGAVAGDFCIIIGCGNSALACSGFTSVAGDVVHSSPASTTFMYKILSAGDISSPPTVTVPSLGAFYVAVYRGPTTSLAKKNTAASTASSVSVSGFTKDGNSKFVIACSHDRDPSGALSAPSGFTSRASATSTYFSHGVYDLPSASYGGGGVTCNLHAATYAGRGTLLELI